MKHLQWLVLCGLLGLLSGIGVAAEQGSISGMIQRQGQGVAEHRIMLLRFGPDGQGPQRTPGHTDAEGRFTFDNLETGDAFEYVVGIRYEGQLYRSVSVRLGAGQQHTGVMVEVEAATPGGAEPEASPSLRIANHFMGVILRSDHLEVREVLRLHNSGSAPSTGALMLPLPRGYYNLSNVQGLAHEHVRQHASGLSYTAPLPPGEQQVLYTYALPLEQKVSTLLLERTLPTAGLDVLVEDAHLVASSDLSFAGRVSIDPHTFWHFQGADLGAQTRSWLQVTRRTAPAMLLQVSAYGLVLGLALLGVGGPVYRLWRQRTPPEQIPVVTAEHLQRLQATRMRLLQTIARLDDQHAAGSLAGTVYQQRRQSYKTQLLALAEQLQQAQDAKESRHP